MDNNDRFLSYQDLHCKATSILLNDSIPFFVWCRSAQRLFAEANSSLENKDNQGACFYLLRFCHIVLNILPYHPQCNKPTLKLFVKNVSKAVEQIEVLKPLLVNDFKEREESRKSSVDIILKSSDDVSFAKHQTPTKSIENYTFTEESNLLRILTNHKPGQKEIIQPVQVNIPRVNHENEAKAIPNLKRLENGKVLRTLIVPSELRNSFYEISKPNTEQNLETCGILCGSLINGAFWIQHLVIPEQISTSDTCQTINEEKLFQYQVERDLLTLGWIHTHPTQTCFMSSVDLHTHCSYQLMLDEAIAIVLAPRYSGREAWKYFRLTDPPGKDYIVQCREPQMFHQHDNIPICTIAQYPDGHAFEVQAPFKITDLRKSNMNNSMSPSNRG